MCDIQKLFKLQKFSLYFGAVNNCGQFNKIK